MATEFAPIAAEDEKSQLRRLARLLAEAVIEKLESGGRADAPPPSTVACGEPDIDAASTLPALLPAPRGDAGGVPGGARL